MRPRRSSDRVVRMSELSRRDRRAERPRRRIRYAPLCCAMARRRASCGGQPTTMPGPPISECAASGALGRHRDVGVEAVPGGDGGAAVQLRGMAVDPAHRAHGVGGQLLAAGVARAFAGGATCVWANARDSALEFYRRHGFEVVGEGFVTPDTGLPHHRIRRLPFRSVSPALTAGPSATSAQETAHAPCQRRLRTRSARSSG